MTDCKNKPDRFAAGAAARRAGRCLLPWALGLSLCGCAAEMAYNDGRALIAEGNTMAGLGKLEEASRLEPGSAEYRLRFLQAREAYAQTLIDRADRNRIDGQFAEAEKGYREALGVQALQERALEGLRQIERQRRWDQMLKRAEQSLAQKDWDSARTTLRAILIENPREPSAMTLMQKLERDSVIPAASSGLSNAYKQPINLEFKEAPLRTIFEVISRASGLNILFDKDVRTDQRTSIFLRNSTVEAAVNWLLLTNQLEARELDANSVLVYPSNQAKQQEYQPLVVKSFYLTSADPKRVGETLRSLLKSRNVVVDESLNLVIVRDSIEAVRLAEKVVALHDVPDPEVMMEVEVLEVKRGRLLDLGINWPDQVGLSVLSSSTSGVLTLKDLHNINNGRISVTGASASVNASQQDSDANILANPRIRARNHEKAKILIGEKLPTITTNVTSTGVSTESINYLDVGLKLEVEPTVYLDNEVAIRIALEVSNINSQQQTKAGSLVYQLGTRTAQTVLRLKDGENQILAGLINDEDRNTAKKVPGFGEVPLVGRLFGQQSNDRTKTEIVLSITPHILRNIQRPADQEFDSGTEMRLRPWPGSASMSPTAGLAPVAIPANGIPQQLPSQALATGTPTAGAAAVPPSDRPAVPEKPPALKLAWQAPSQVKAGEQFSIQLAVEGSQPIGTVPVMMEFDPNVLQIVGVAEGELIRSGGKGSAISHKLGQGGQLSLTARRVDAEGSSQPTAGVLATLSLKAKMASGPMGSQLVVVRAAATDKDGHEITIARPTPLNVQIAN